MLFRLNIPGLGCESVEFLLRKPAPKDLIGPVPERPFKLLDNGSDAPWNQSGYGDGDVMGCPVPRHGEAVLILVAKKVVGILLRQILVKTPLASSWGCKTGALTMDNVGQHQGLR